MNATAGIALGKGGNKQRRALRWLEGGRGAEIDSVLGVLLFLER